MKILVVQESDWIKRGPHNTHHLLERLSEKGHEIRVIDYEINWSDNKKHELISRRMEVKDFHKVRDNARITVIRPSILHITPLNYISLLYTHKKEIKRQIREFKPDVVIGLGILNGYLAVNECKKNKIPFVYFVLDTLHTLVHERLFQEFAKKIEQYNYKHSDLVISVNKLLREYTISMGADENRAIVLPHGIELSRFADATKEREHMREKYGFNNDDIVLFFMGYLYTFSGLIPVTEYLKNNLIKYPNVKLFIVGEGPIYEQLMEFKKDIPENFVVLGWQPYNDIPSIISASDICILPSELNNTMNNIVPIKLLEYMAAGKAILTTKLPGIMKEFDNNTGIIYVNKIDDFITIPSQLFGNGYYELCEKSTIYVKDLDWSNIVCKFENNLEQILNY